MTAFLAYCGGHDLAAHLRAVTPLSTRFAEVGPTKEFLSGLWDPGHARGDTITWVEEEKVLLSGDRAEYQAGVYTSEATTGGADVNKALDDTPRWATMLFQAERRHYVSIG